MRNGLPDDIQINIEIAVDESISHANHIIPGYCHAVLPRTGTYTACCFANNLEVSQDRKDKHPITIKICTSLAGREFESLGRCIPYVLKSDKVSLVHE